MSEPKIERYRRKSDGAIVTAATTTTDGWSVLLTREDTGRSYWASLQGLRRNYERIEEGENDE